MQPERVLVTGASSGIGRELAKLFAKDGCDLVVVARSTTKLNELADEIRNTWKVDVVVLACDLSDSYAVKNLVEQLQQSELTIDILANNAGFGAVGRFQEMDLERQLDMIQVNVTAVVQLARLLLPAMLRQGRGGLLNIASTAAFQPGPWMATYYASKAFVLSFSEALTEEVAGTGVTVTCLAPGATQTGFGADSGMEASMIFRLGAMSATKVAKAGHRGFRKGKSVVVPGWKNKLGTLLVRLSPRAVTRKLVKRLQSVDGLDGRVFDE